MQQHPVPQNVTSYQFRLVGDMTLKQFLELAGGGGIAVMFYLSNLPLPIKWFFIIISALCGIALAFIPLEERPLDRWVGSFFKSAYQPTQFTWKKASILPDFLKPSKKTPPPPTKQEDSHQKAQAKKQQVVSFLHTLPQESLDQIDEFEAQRLSQINQLFSSVTPSQITPVLQKILLPYSPIVTNRPLRLTPEEGEKVLKGEIDLSKISAGIIMQIPPDSPVSIAKKSSRKLLKKPFSKTLPQPTPNQTTTGLPAKSQPASAAKTSQKLPFPSIPTTPNTLVGMVLNQNNNIVESAIVEVSDANHIPVRAFKTNKLGQFFSATPLKDGHYQIEIEKDNLNFDILSLELKGDIVSPLEIHSKPNS